MRALARLTLVAAVASVAASAGAQSARPEPAVEAPMSLTAGDGTGLKLVKLVGRAVVEAPLAFTELRLTFENPQDRTLEGQFRITLPQGAAISRFAMKLGDRWQEGEVVERQAARRAYEDFLHRRQDPALMEQNAGNEFTARVFPIPARGVKELIVSYSHELGSSGAPYVLPLRGLPQLGELDVAAAIAGAPSSAAELKKKSFVPNADFVLAADKLPQRNALRAGNLLLARVRPVATSSPEPVTSALVLVDTSASRALGFREQVALVQRLVAEVVRRGGPSVPVTVAAFDQSLEAVFEGEAGKFGDAELKRLRDRRALGASDLQRALHWAAGQAQKRPAKRVVLVTDGVPTAGAVEGDELIAAALKLKQVGVERLDVIAVGGIRDDALLRRLATAGLARDGVVLDGATDAETLGRRLSEATRSRIELKVEGATWWWPRKIDGAQAGDEVLVYAQLADGKSPRVLVGGAAAELGKVATVELPLLERAWAQAKIASLQYRQDVEADGAAQKAELQKEIVQISVRHRVLSPYTALLVLETEQDYARFDINRNALADILTVDGGRLAVVKRAPPAATPPAPKPERFASKMKGGDASKRRSLADTAAADDDATLGAVDMAKDDAAPAEPQAEREMEERPAPAPVASAAEYSPRREAPAGAPAPRAPRESVERRRVAPRPDDADESSAPRKAELAYVGKFREVMQAIARGAAKDKALAVAQGWREEDPGDVMALAAMGEVFEAVKDLDRAARAYGSIIDLFPGRADLRRFAGERLERLRDAGLGLAIDTYAKAAAQRPDHPASHRLLAFALLKKGEPAKAFEAMLAGVKRSYPSGRFAGVSRILGEDLGLIAAAWIKKEPGRRAEILAKLREAGGAAENAPSVRFVLNWETDANDVDFHIYDGKGGHAYYGSRELPSGGELYADVTTGYGPECFTIRLPKEKRAYPYRLQAHYYSRGPMGYGMGKLQVVEHDGEGGLKFEERPFIVMVDGAYLDLGTVAR